MNILIINGANLNMLGKRQTDIYGSETLEDINNFLKEKFAQDNLVFFQSNSEGEIIDKIHTAVDYDGLVLNAGGYSHYSISILDAVLAILPVKTVEVHLTDIYEREEFRRKSIISYGATKCFCGEHKYSYVKGIQYLKDIKNGV